MRTNLATVFVLLGANLGDRTATLARARALLGTIGHTAAASAVYETAAWGYADQPAFLNQVMVLRTALPPEAVLDVAQATERALGRQRAERWHARTIDVDLLYYNDLRLRTDRLCLPHPQIAHRRFTLVPLAEVAPDFVHPTLHQTHCALLAACPDPLAVVRYRAQA